MLKKDRDRLDKDLKALKETAEDVERRAIEKANTAERTALERMGIMEAELSRRVAAVETGLDQVKRNYRSEFESVRTDIRCTREQILEKIADLKVSRAEFFVTKDEMHEELKDMRATIQSLKK